MKPKNVLTILILAFALVTVIVALAPRAGRQGKSDEVTVSGTNSRSDAISPETDTAAGDVADAPAAKDIAVLPETGTPPTTPQREAPKRTEAVEPQDTETSAPSAPEPAAPAAPQRLVVAYYFHGNYRCQSCIRIEELTHDVVFQYFGDLIDAGKLDWQPVNVEKPGNEHFISDYRLYTRSVVIVEFEDGRRTRWKNLTRVWELLNNDVAFMQYVQREIDEYVREL